MIDFSSYFPITDSTWIFFIVLLIILFAPMIMSKLRIPHIIGMVLAGVIVGQYGLNILQRDGSFELFGQVGLYYIMFLAGLEMDLEGIKKHMKRMIIFGLLTFLMPFILVYFAGIYLMNYSKETTLLLCCIMASNTLIAYPIVCKYGLQRHKAVSLSVGASMIALLLALLSLSLFVGVVQQYQQGKGLGSVAVLVVWILVKLFLYCAAGTFVIPRITRWFLRRNADAVTQFIFVLAILFLNAAMTSFIGLEGVFGAFFAGLLLNRYIPRVSPLMGRIEFIGNAIFIPYFLIGVGMLINVRTLFSGLDILWIVFLIVFFGTFGKALAAYISSLLFRLSKADGHMMFGLTSAHAAGAIAMVMVGMRLEVGPGEYLINDIMLNGVVMMILFTCVISTLMTEHASQQIIIQEKAHQDREIPRDDDEKILLCVKYPDIAPHLLYLSMLMRNQRLNRELVALNVVYDDQKSNQSRQDGLQLLERLQQLASASDVKVQTQVRLATNIANGIKHAFREFACSEIIMGMHVHTDINPRFWGEFIQSLYNGLNRQIILTRFVQPMSTLRRIQVVVPSRAEFEPGFHRWLERLSRLAEQLDCRIQFHGRNESLVLIAEYVNNRHPSARAEYTPMSHWNELPQLASGISEDHLFVVVTARKGTISYKNALERLPDELQKHFSGKNLMIVFPDQYGDQKEDRMSFTEAQHHEEKSIYETILRWIHEKRK